MNIPPSSQLRDFLLGAKSLMAAVTALLAALTALLVAAPQFLKSITTLHKEWKHMQPKSRFEGVKSVVRKRSVLLPLMLAVLLASTGGGLLLGRAAVADTGKSIGNVTKFSVDENYYPTGKMGDTSDLAMSKEEGFVRFTYNAEGRGPHKWDYQIVDGKENPQPAQFAGYMYLDPQNNWGTDPEGGYDLRGCHRVIKWEARSADGEVKVEFVIGGDKRQWDTKTNDRVPVPYPNSISRNFGAKRLTTDWQPYEADLSTLADERFKRIVGGFGWVVTWDANGVKLNKEQTGAEHPKSFTIEIRNIRYEK